MVSPSTRSQRAREGKTEPAAADPRAEAMSPGEGASDQTGMETTDRPAPAASSAIETLPVPVGQCEDMPCADQPLSLRVEALLLASDRPASESQIAVLLGLPSNGAVAAMRAAIGELNALYQQTNRSFRVEKVAGGWQVLTLPAFGPVLSRLQRERQAAKLSQAALETLAIIAYRQPILRSDIEAIRGVAC